MLQSRRCLSVHILVYMVKISRLHSSHQIAFPIKSNLSLYIFYNNLRKIGTKRKTDTVLIPIPLGMTAKYFHLRIL